MPTSFAERVVLITGAASGIGRQLCRVLAAEGARLAAVDRSAGGLASLAEELKAAGMPADRFAAAAADVTHWPALQRAVAGLEGQLGPTAVLIACAGIGRETSALDYDAPSVNEIIGVNLIGVSNAIAAVLPGMRERRAGHLVALSSLASYHGVPLMGAYCASKAGVNALLNALRVELQPLGVAVTTVCPGWIRTPMTDAVRLPPRVRRMTVEAAAALILKAVRERRPFAAFPTGGVWEVRLLRYLPRSLSDWLLRRHLRALGRL